MALDSPKPRPVDSSGRPIRLQRFLAQCGLGSRRACELLIADGKVSVNGRPVERQGVSIVPGVDKVLVEGRAVAPQSSLYLLINKPRDVICTASDPQGRRTVFDLIPGIRERLFTIGRLDRQSEGLLILTTDGDFAQSLAHPSHGVKKTYHCWSETLPTRSQLDQFVRGIVDDGEVLKAESASLLRHGPSSCTEIVLKQGRNRQIRRMFEACGLQVVRLVRVAIGPLSLRGVPSGKVRALTPRELEQLRGTEKPVRRRSGGRRS